MTIDVHDYQAYIQLQTEIKERLDAYDGNFQFLLEMRELGKDPEYYFSIRQIEAIQKSLDRHLQAKIAPPMADVPALLTDALPEGTSRHAVMNQQGHLTFIRIDRVIKGNWDGWFFVKQVVGPEETRIGAQRPNGEYRGQWDAMLREINSDPKASMARYGREIGYCGMCNLRLTDELSRERGIGPICWGKFD
jgi:hypothetical protein